MNKRDFVEVYIFLFMFSGGESSVLPAENKNRFSING